MEPVSILGTAGGAYTGPGIPGIIPGMFLVELVGGKDILSCRKGQSLGRWGLVLRKYTVTKPSATVFSSTFRMTLIDPIRDVHDPFYRSGN